MESTLGVSQSNLQPSCISGGEVGACAEQVTVSQRDAAMPSQHLLPSQLGPGSASPAAASQACLLPGEGSGERRVNARLSPRQHIPARCGLVIIHLSGFAFACTSAGKQAQAHKKRSAGAARQPRPLPIFPVMGLGTCPSRNPTHPEITCASASHLMTTQLRTPKSDIFRGVQGPPPSW